MADDSELHKLMRYISGEDSPEEVSDIRARLERDPDLRAQVESWQRVRDARPPAWNTERALADLRRELRHGQARPSVRLVAFPERGARAARRIGTYALRSAAVLLLTIGLAAIWRVGRTPTGRAAATPVVLQEYTAPRGGRATFRLADGTLVMLAADTRLRVPRDFGRRGHRRDVELEGAAYFQVTHDETRPFVVRTPNTVTEDLGTAFAIRAYPTESIASVAVAEGTVAVHSAHGAVDAGPARRIVTRGHVAHVEVGGGIQVEQPADLMRHLAWTKGMLAFDRLPFRDAALDIERWYDLDVRLADPALGARRISGVFESESADAVLGYLASALDARYERHGRTVTFVPR